MESDFTLIVENWQLEKQEWLESIDAVLQEYGEEKAKDLLKTIIHFVIRKGVAFQGENINTPYINTINVRNQPTFPGDIELEQKIENIEELFKNDDAFKKHLNMSNKMYHRTNDLEEEQNINTPKLTENRIINNYF
jgi:hypothetical protein